MRQFLYYSSTVISLLVIMSGCSSNTKITASWKNPSFTPAPSPTRPANEQRSVFIASFSRNMEVRTKLENALAAEAAKRNIRAVKSTDFFSPDFYGKEPSREDMMSRISQTGVGAILTVSLIDKESETRYVPGSAYSPYPAFGYYGGFYRYYNYWYSRIYDPGYYVTDKTYFLETNLYDAKTEELIWSAQSETVNPGGIDNFVAEYPNKLVARLIDDGLLKG